MDIATPAGLLIGFVLLIISVIMGGGASGIAAFINIPSMMIVVGGTICATLVRYPLQRVTGVISLIMKTIFVKLSSPQKEMLNLIDYAKIARREGLLALENKIAEIKDSFLSKSIQLLVDGTDADGLRTILEKEIENVRGRHAIGKGVLESMGTGRSCVRYDGDINRIGIDAS